MIIRNDTMARKDIVLNVYKCVILFFLWLVMMNCSTEDYDNTEKINNDEPKGVKDGIHEPTGLVYAEGFEIVSAACTGCHSAKLITQNRASKEGWIEMIRWMQATQGLGDLGEFEKPIVDYLSTHYSPKHIGRRPNLDTSLIQWYVLQLEED